MNATAEETPHVRLPVEIQDLVAAGTISISAGWLYGLMLAHFNYRRGDSHVWPSRGFLSKRMGFKNSRAVDRYLDELVAAGLVEKECRRNGAVNESNRYTLAVVSWPTKHEGGSAQPDTTPGINSTPPVVSERAPELDEPQLDEDELDPWGNEPNRLPSARSAHSGAGKTGNQADDDRDAAAADTEPSTGSWWIEDRDKFRQVFGDWVVSDGVNGWKRGVFPVNEVYSALRQRPDKRITKPGSYVVSLMDKQDGAALENWMLREGFSLPDGAAP
ncbi:hypothetical protein [Micromonospora carbonacea]|uniref:hypothetical protein n=1 Tax=Micromonospora carbonacea TaxID=47853 RepID=UPI003721E5F7